MEFVTDFFFLQTDVKEKQKKLAENNFKKEEILLDSAKEAAEKEKAKKAKEASESTDKKTSKNSSKKKSKLSVFSDDDEDEENPDFDVQLREALRIMGDWIQVIDSKKSAAKNN